MIVYPAIDLRQGRCVRLRQGNFGAETVFNDDPASAAARWADEGAQWLHVVNLDGALGVNGESNLEAIERIRRTVRIPIQVGGGIRTQEDVQRLFDAGINRAILGTVAADEPDLVQKFVEVFGPESIVIGIDARDGVVTTHGWTKSSGIQAIDLALHMGKLGIKRLVYTDISRDGMLTGPNVLSTVELAERSGLAVIASGGVSSIEDIQVLAQQQAEGIDGVIIGMALYRGRINLREAIACAREVN